MNREHPVQAYRDMVELLEEHGYRFQRAEFGTTCEEETPLNQFTVELDVERVKNPKDN